MPDDSARVLRSRLTARSATSVSVIAALSAGIGSAVFRSSPEKPTSTAANSQHRTKMIIFTLGTSSPDPLRRRSRGPQAPLRSGGSSAAAKASARPRRSASREGGRCARSRRTIDGDSIRCGYNSRRR